MGFNSGFKGLTRQEMCVLRNIEARSHNHRCRRKQYYIFWVCVCSLIYPACKAHVPYYIV